MKVEVRITRYRDVIVELSDPKIALKDYRDCINSDAEIDDVYKAVATFAEDDFVEGVGSKNMEYIVYEVHDYDGDIEIEKL